ncbi:E3 ubiquitin-protein ligase RNF181 isoform X2 [Wyeomyia smithii]|uniref:E3 ubiquitin-protein ligase RNF181 isoform X2 n=1 Tax=Wyeomyia smithii TaxID=174621 RepID=UPI0024680ACD|nr:E3 ubiquitin-protein ligase RNF181 isoform X2 [Wyeomyia smithii]
MSSKEYVSTAVAQQFKMADYFDELGCEPITAEQTQNHQLMLMVRFLQQNGFFADELSSESLPPPASKELVKNLPEKLVTREDERCAICIKPNEDVNEPFLVLPCKHDFHKSCILPWLEKTNSCPLCRFEMKTDDENYEEQKKFRQRAVQREQEIEELHNSMYG